MKIFDLTVFTPQEYLDMDEMNEKANSIQELREIANQYGETWDYPMSQLISLLSQKEKKYSYVVVEDEKECRVFIVRP